jgi:hypothetical protein
MRRQVNLQGAQRPLRVSNFNWESIIVLPIARKKDNRQREDLTSIMTSTTDLKLKGGGDSTSVEWEEGSY